MNKKIPVLSVLFTIIIVTLLITTICGICSFNTKNSYDVVNHYGDTVKMWGSGLYCHDSYFSTPLFIGSDFTILVLVIPLAIISFCKLRKEKSIENYIQIFSYLSVFLYYSAGLAFGVTYNKCHLLYIFMFSASLFGVCLLYTQLHTVGVLREVKCEYPFTKGMKVFLILSGISLFVAWLPDIITSLVKGTSLNIIDVYTTIVTYVLDMGIVSPLMFLTYYLMSKNDFIGYIFMRMLLKLCIVVGVMLPMQSVFQLLAGITLPIQAVITKILIFVMLAAFAFYFEYQLKKKTCYKNVNGGH